MTRWLKRLIIDVTHLALIAVAFWFGFKMGDTSGAYRGHYECVQNTEFPTLGDLEKLKEAIQ